MANEPSVLNAEQVHMLKHAWGFEARKPGYRSHYCTEIDDPLMNEMVDHGFFSGPRATDLVAAGHGIYHLTDKAIDLLKRLKAMELLQQGVTQ